MTDSPLATPDAEEPDASAVEQALGHDALEEIDDILDDLRTRG